ncbi:MAG TPA: site-specific integrase [Planctomycetaceae bacterium]|nr:site-specific integrase [Planctomycetaceae bacterium]
MSVYFHHAAWWLYYREGSRPVRRRVSLFREEAERLAAEINAEVTTRAPTTFAFLPVSVTELQAKFLTHHEEVLRSSVATIQRYRTATQHLLDFGGSAPAHEVSTTEFVTFLRSRKVSPNGHVNSVKRHLRDKGVQFVLETCRAMFAFAQRQRHLPPYASNPFADLRLDRMRIEDAKSVFVFDATSELQFLKAAYEWEFPIQFTLAKTGLRPGELCHLLIEELDLEGGWLHVRNKPELGWSIKTRNERSVPLVEELQLTLRSVVGSRTAGVVFQRPKFQGKPEALGHADRKTLAQELIRRCQHAVETGGVELSREGRLRLARQLWRDAGALDPDLIRRSFLRIAHRCGLISATCPKSWRHTFATLLQDANVDPLLRQITLGHQPAGAGGALGMTGVYTHSRPETHAREIRRALALWPAALALARQRSSSDALTCCSR